MPVTVTVTVTDKYGASVTKSFQVTVTNVAPTATLVLPATVNEGAMYTLAVANVLDSSADTAAGFTYAFDCGNGAGYGAFGTATSVACAPAADNGKRTVGVKVKDKDGGIGTFSQVMTINNAPPRPTILSPSSGSTYAVASTVTVTVGFTDLGKNDQAHTCSADWGDGSSSSGTVSEVSGSMAGTCTLTHAYAVAATYTVTVTVTDKDGGQGTTTLSLVISSSTKKGPVAPRTLLSVGSRPHVPVTVKTRPARRRHAKPKLKPKRHRRV